MNIPTETRQKHTYSIGQTVVCKPSWYAYGHEGIETYDFIATIIGITYGTKDAIKNSGKYMANHEAKTLVTEPSYQVLYQSTTSNVLGCNATYIPIGKQHKT